MALAEAWLLPAQCGRPEDGVAFISRGGKRLTPRRSAPVMRWCRFGELGQHLHRTCCKFSHLESSDPAPQELLGHADIAI